MKWKWIDRVKNALYLLFSQNFTPIFVPHLPKFHPCIPKTDHLYIIPASTPCQYRASFKQRMRQSVVAVVWSYEAELECLVHVLLTADTHESRSLRELAWEHHTTHRQLTSVHRHRELPTEICHLVVVVGLMHRWPGRFLIWRRGANQEQTAW